MSALHPLTPGHDLGPGPSPDINSVATLEWCLVKVYWLHEVFLLSRTPDCHPDLIKKLLSEYKKSEPWLAKAVPFLVPTIYTATPASLPSEALSHVLGLVDIDMLHYSHVLIPGLYNHPTFPTPALFLPSYTRLATVPEPVASVRARDALFIKLQLSKLALLVFVTLTLLLAVAAGVAAGLVRHSLETGLGVFGTVLSIVGVVEGYLTWRLK